MIVYLFLPIYYFSSFLDNLRDAYESLSEVQFFVGSLGLNGKCVASRVKPTN